MLLMPLRSHQHHDNLLLLSLLSFFNFLFACVNQCCDVIWIFKEPPVPDFLNISKLENCGFWFFERSKSKNCWSQLFQKSSEVYDFHERTWFFEWLFDFFIFWRIMVIFENQIFDFFWKFYLWTQRTTLIFIMGMFLFLIIMQHWSKLVLGKYHCCLIIWFFKELSNLGISLIFKTKEPLILDISKKSKSQKNQNQRAG